MASLNQGGWVAEYSRSSSCVAAVLKLEVVPVVVVDDEETRRNLTRAPACPSHESQLERVDLKCTHDHALVTENTCFSCSHVFVTQRCTFVTLRISGARLVTFKFLRAATNCHHSWTHHHNN